MNATAASQVSSSAPEPPTRQGNGRTLGKLFLFQGKYLPAADIAFIAGKTPQNVRARAREGKSLDDQAWINGDSRKRGTSKYKGRSDIEWANHLGLPLKTFRYRVRDHGWEKALEMGGARRREKLIKDPTRADGAMECPTACKCPCCGAKHTMSLFWLGDIPAKKLCKRCRQIYA